MNPLVGNVAAWRLVSDAGVWGWVGHVALGGNERGDDYLYMSCPRTPTRTTGEVSFVPPFFGLHVFLHRLEDDINGVTFLVLHGRLPTSSRRVHDDVPSRGFVSGSTIGAGLSRVLIANLVLRRASFAAGSLSCQLMRPNNRRAFLGSP